MVSARVSVNKILCKTIIGIYPDELCEKQNVEFGFSFEYDCKQAISADSIDEAVDYAVLTEDLKTFVFNSKFKLLETLTAEIAKRILAFSPKITSAKVYCIKLNALCPRAEIEWKK
ncbi:MAG: dihydroneopterin aldolase [Fibromonadaceae bacterium]|jgi:dihydroneopterin aldolase|nr:dihydroneopterin aldolase [Fibromonadaceae bacterium]